MSIVVIFESIQVREGDHTNHIPDVILAEHPHSLDKYQLLKEHGIEQIFSTGCIILANHDQEFA